MEPCWTIYCHIHVDGRRYVGLTKKTMLHRWNRHVYDAKAGRSGNTHFANAIRKYGPAAFSHEVLEVCHDLEVANLAEECWIEFYDTRNPEKGFNLMKGGAHMPHPMNMDYLSDPVWQARHREGVLRSLQDSEVLRRRSDGSRLTWSRQSMRDQDAARKAILSSNPAFSAKCSAALKEKWQDPEYREKKVAESRARASDPKFCAKLSEASRMSNHNLKKTHCIRGHQLAPKSERTGWRQCRICRNELQKERRRLQRNIGQ